MQGLGKNSTVKLGRKKLHIQSAVSESHNSVVVSVFDNGTLVFKRYFRLEDKLSQEAMTTEVEISHQAVAADLDLLFYVQEKVRKVEHAPSRYKMGLLFLQKNFFEEAIEEFEQATRIDSKRAEYFFDLGKAYYLKGDFDCAVTHFQQAGELAPVYADIRYALGFTHWKNQNFHDAILEFQRAVEFNEKYHQAIYALGLVLIDSAEKIPTDARLAPPIKRIEKGEDYLRRALDLSENYNKKKIEKGLVLVGKRKFGEAMDLFFEASYDMGIQIKEASEGEFFLKFMYGGHGRDDLMVDEYITSMQEQVSKNPGYADLKYNLGVAHLIKGRNLYLRAMEDLREALAINPKFAKAKRSLRLIENDSKGLLILLRAILSK